MTILGTAGSRKRKYKNWVNLSNGIKSWSMDSSDVTEGYPINSDITPTDNHEDNTLLRSNREAKKVLSNPIVDEFIFIDLQPIEIEKNEFVIAHDDSQLQNNNVYLKFNHRTQLNFVNQNKQNLTNGSSIMSTMKLKMSDKNVSQEDGYVLAK